MELTKSQNQVLGSCFLFKALSEKEKEEAKAMGIPLVRYDLDNPRHIPVLPEELYNEAKAFGDTAIFCVTRFSTENTMKGDRKGGKGDFTMHDEEKDLIEQLARDFDLTRQQVSDRLYQTRKKLKAYLIKEGVAV